MKAVPSQELIARAFAVYEIAAKRDPHVPPPPTTEKELIAYIADNGSTGDPAGWDSEAFHSLVDEDSREVNNLRDKIAARLAAMRARTLTLLDELPPPSPLIDGVLDLGTAATLFAQWGAFKSFVAVDFAGHVGLGLPDWMRHEIPERRAVYVLAFEAPASLHMRLRAWCQYHGIDPADTVGWIYLDPKPGRLTDPLEVDALRLYLDELDIGLVIVDTIARTAKGVQENSSEFGDLFHLLDEELASDRRAVLAIAHAGKDATKGIRGHSSAEGAVDTQLVLTRDRDPETGTPRGPAVFSIRKRKDDATSTAHNVDITIEDLDGHHVGVLIPTTSAPTSTPTTPSSRGGIDRARSLIIARLTKARDGDAFGTGYVPCDALIDGAKRTPPDRTYRSAVTRDDARAALDELEAEDLVDVDELTGAVRLPLEADPDAEEQP